MTSNHSIIDRSQVTASVQLWISLLQTALADSPARNLKNWSKEKRRRNRQVQLLQIFFKLLWKRKYYSPQKNPTNFTDKTVQR